MNQGRFFVCICTHDAYHGAVFKLVHMMRGENVAPTSEFSRPKKRCKGHME